MPEVILVFAVMFATFVLVALAERLWWFALAFAVAAFVLVAAAVFHW